MEQGSSRDAKGKGKAKVHFASAHVEDLVEPKEGAGARRAEAKQDGKKVDDPYIRVRLSHLDWVDVQPDDTSDLALRTSPLVEQSRLHKVPEIRVFGATERGQRILLHVHGTMPYFYIQYDGDLNPDNVNDFIRRLAASLNYATATSLGRTNAFDSKKNQFVAYIAFCKGIPFYGFHVGYRYFLKIYCCQPTYKKRMAALLRTGHVMPKKVGKGRLDESRNPGGGFKIFEEHVPFHLQFMLDHNLYGCGFIDLRKCKFRRPLPDTAPSGIASSHGSSTASDREKPAYTISTVGDDMLGPPHLEKLSHCALEADVHVSDILNRERIAERHLHQDFTELLESPIPEDEKLVNSVKELWEDERRRRRDRGEKGPEEVRETGDASQRDYKRGEQPTWATEPRLREEIARLVDKDRRRRTEKHGAAAFKNLSFEQFVQPEAPLQKHYVRTTFEAVAALFPATLTDDEEKENPYGIWAVRGIDVNAGPKEVIGADDVVDASGFSFQDRDDLEGPEPDAAEVEEEVMEQEKDEDSEMVDDLPPVPIRSTDEDEGIAEEVMAAEDAPTSQSSGEPLNPATQRGAPRPEWSAPTALFLDSSSDDEGDPANPSPRRTPAKPSPMKVVANGTPSRSTRSSAQITPIKIAALPSATPSPTKRPSHRLNPFASPSKQATAPQNFAKPRHEGERRMALRNEGLQAIGSQERKRPITEQVAAYNQPRAGKLARMFGIDSVAGGERHARPDAPDSSYSSAESPLLDPTLVLQTSDKSASSQETIRAPTPTVLERISQDVPEFAPTMIEATSQDFAGIAPTMVESTSQDEAMPDVVYPSSPVEPQSSDKSAQRSSDASTRKAANGDLPSEDLKSSNEQSKPSSASERVSSGIKLPGSSLETRSSDAAPVPLPPTRPTPLFRFRKPAPRTAALFDSIAAHKVYQPPYFSNDADVPSRPREYAGRVFRIGGEGLKFMPDFEHKGAKQVGKHPMARSQAINIKRWEFSRLPPRPKAIKAGEKRAEAPGAKASLLKSQIEAPTQLNGGHKFTPMKAGTTTRVKQHMDVLAIEVLGESRDGKLPDPVHDEIVALFYCLQNEDDSLSDNGEREGTHAGVIIVASRGDDVLAQMAADCRLSKCLSQNGVVVDVVDDEEDLIDLLVYKVQHWDPEVLTGYEIESWSWGYLLQRGEQLGLDRLPSNLGRMKAEGGAKRGGKNDRWGSTHGSTLKIPGRHVLALWRILRSDVTLNSYSIENIAFHVLRRRIPHYSADTQWRLWTSSSTEHRIRILRYWLLRVELDLHLMDEVEIISRNAEFARVFGVDFYSVITRGSQFKVESVMFRIAKPENFLLPSPSREEVGKQNAAECIPLIMEPESAFYTSPLLVLDFQSLYPSVMIAYNLCYSTCLGRVGSFKGTYKFGTSTLNLPDGLLTLLQDHVFVTPNGFMFVKPHVRKSLLSKMLSEILDTRVMVKQSMKRVVDDKALTKMLNARQLGLKFIANVTYGYTSATFSGRMPAVEIADAIVQTGRETLEKAMTFIESVSEWGAHVKYGDTDSLFVYLPGKTKDEAFRIGNEIADAVTKRNPAPVKLKFEKVYLPCVLVAKKRYVGFKYENFSDLEPEFDCKGLEVIRRDGNPALQKLQEATIKILFRSQDLSAVKDHLYRNFKRMQQGRVSPQDFIIAKEVKLGSYSTKVAPPPGPIVAKVRMDRDPRLEPAYAERVPYVITRAERGALVRDRAVPPENMLENRHLRIDDEYYITRSFLPAIGRIFNLVGANVEDWYKKMPRKVRVDRGNQPAESSQTVEEAQKAQPKIAIDQHFKSNACVACGDRIVSEPGIKPSMLCPACTKDRPTAIFRLLGKHHHAEQRKQDLHLICTSCSDVPASESVECDSLDCPVLYSRVRAGWDCEDGQSAERKGRKLAEEWEGSSERLEQPSLVW